MNWPVAWTCAGLERHLLRAAKAAWETAIITNTELIVAIGGRIRGVSAEALRQTASLQEEHQVTTLITEIPEQLARQAQQMVDSGWAANMGALITESLRRYVESHQEVLNEQFLREDVEWGLNGDD